VLWHFTVRRSRIDHGFTEQTEYSVINNLKDAYKSNLWVYT
jgi:hypothetical protein